MSTSANSISLQLESLTSQYNKTLLQYQQAVTNYIQLMQNATSSTGFVNVPSSVFWGANPIGSPSVYTNLGTATQCQSLCSKTTGCSGATFSVSNGINSCYLRTGDGPVVPSGTNNTAIVPQALQYLENIQILNQQLTDLNEQIVNIITNQGDSLYMTEATERAVNNRTIKQNYDNLVEERNMINQQINNLQNLEQEQYTSELSTNSNYFSYVLLLLLAIIIIIILFSISTGGRSSSYNMQRGGNLSNKAYYIVFAIIFAVVFLYYIFV